MNRLRIFWFGFCLSALAYPGFAADSIPSGRTINFSRDIRPLLSETCFACHGPDEETRKAKLRLDTKDGAISVNGDGAHIIKPGHSAESEFYKRLIVEDPDDRMPPEKTGKVLTSEQIALLKEWIDQGAQWETHWAFETPVRPELPEVKNADWVKNPIDNFTLAKMEREGVEPQPEADRATLVRRASLDLTGLPPSIEEVDAFLADENPGSYEKVVDRLLDSNRYGEHMARYWLDGARYADSHGYHIDSVRSIWKYRDWVINAFNENMPFDQFTKEQIAGDLLPDATLSQKIASGYIRCNMSTGEGGAIEEEYRAKYVFDRLETTSTLWLGLTMTCARCHTHKYDPITHQEYYQMAAFFNSMEEPVMDGNKPNPDPFIKVPSPEQSERMSWLKEQIRKTEEKLTAANTELDQKEPAWREKWHATLNEAWTPLEISAVSSNAPTIFKNQEDKSVVAEATGSDEITWHLTVSLPAGRLGGLRLETLPDAPKDGKPAEGGTLKLVEIEAEIFGEGAQKLTFHHVAADEAVENSSLRNAIDGKGDTHWELANTHGQAHKAILLLGESRSLEKPAQLAVRLRLKGRDSERAIKRFRLSAATEPTLLANLFPVKLETWRLIGPFKGDDVKAAFEKEYPPEKELDFSKAYPGVRDEIRWNEQGGYQDGRSHVFVSDLHGVHGVFYFHRKIHAADSRKMEISLKADDIVRVWFNGKEVATRDRMWELGEPPIQLTLDLAKGENDLLVKVVNHQGESRFRFDKFLIDQETIPTDLAVLLAVAPQLEGEDGKKVQNHYRAIHSPDWKKLSEDLVLWKEEQQSLDKEIPTTLIAKEAATVRDTFILTRGEYDKHGEKVSRATPSALLPFPSSYPTNRLGLAKWLVHPDHPLTARVVVNRFWQHYFGLGLVKTTEDFGMQSDNPSHPELLDWLATEFIRSGWDIKHMQRLILTSATYRQSSAAPASLYEADPENRLLARGPRFRVDAETLRDTALALGGLLVEEMGGPSIKPYQPPGLWEAVSYNNSQKYVQDEGEEQYKRSLYIHWKRQSPPPNMLLFDAPTREYCVVRRPRTNTPLQALALMNDPQYVEASRGFAWRILREGGKGDKARLEYAFKLATAREPSEVELATLEKLLKAQIEDFSGNQVAAEKLLKVGDWQPSGETNKATLAAWTTVASVIMNLDETVTKN